MKTKIGKIKFSHQFHHEDKCIERFTTRVNAQGTKLNVEVTRFVQIQRTFNYEELKSNQGK